MGFGKFGDYGRIVVRLGGSDDEVARRIGYSQELSYAAASKLAL